MSRYHSLSDVQSFNDRRGQAPTLPSLFKISR